MIYRNALRYMRQIFREIDLATPIVLIDINIWVHLNIIAAIFQMTLTHFTPLIPFYTPGKHQKTRVFIMFSGDQERDQRHEID